MREAVRGPSFPRVARVVRVTQNAKLSEGPPARGARVVSVTEGARRAGNLTPSRAGRRTGLFCRVDFIFTMTGEVGGDSIYEFDSRDAAVFRYFEDRAAGFTADFRDGLARLRCVTAAGVRWMSDNCA